MFLLQTKDNAAGAAGVTPDENQSQHQASHTAATPGGTIGGPLVGNALLAATGGGHPAISVAGTDPNSALATAGVTTTDG